MRQFNEKALASFQLNGQAWGDYSDQPKAGKENGDCHAMLNSTKDWMTPLCDPTNYGGVNLHATMGMQFSTATTSCCRVKSIDSFISKS